MTLARFVAVVLLLQGLAPAMLVGVARPDGWFLLAVALLYTLLAWGLWTARRWALLLALALTAAQLIVLSTPWLSWQFFVAARYGLGVASAPTIGQMPIFKTSGVGVRFDAAISEPSATLLATFAGVSSPSFMFVNLLALPPLVLLLVLARRWPRVTPPPLPPPRV